MRENRLRVLVIEDDPERVQLLEEAFAEMEEVRFSRPAYPACAHDYALDWHEAIDMAGKPRRSPEIPGAKRLLKSRRCPASGIGWSRGPSSCSMIMRTTAIGILILIQAAVVWPSIVARVIGSFSGSLSPSAVSTHRKEASSKPRESTLFNGLFLASA